MLTIATDIHVCLSRGFTQLWCAKTAERIEVLFGVKTWGPKEHHVRRGSYSPHGDGEGEALHYITLSE